MTNDNSIQAHVLAAERIHGDDTTVPVLAKSKTHIARLWGYVRDDRPFGGATPPPYKATHAGDAGKWQQVYAAACASCHGENAQKPGKDGSILDGSLLALINDQTIRTTIIAGRPDIGQPDWRSDLPGHPMSDQEVTDVVGWLSSQRKSIAGGSQ